MREGDILIVENVTGVAEEKGFRLSWLSPDGKTSVPALGLVTSNPFRSESEAVAYGERQFGERAKRYLGYGRPLVNIPQWKV